MSATADSAPLLGAYGIAVPPDAFAPRLNLLPEDTPTWSFSVHGSHTADPVSGVPDAGPVTLVASGTRATIAFDGSAASATLLVGTLRADGRTRDATFTPHAPFDGERLVHPTLATLGALAAHWSDFAALHAGAVLVDGQAWGLLAARGHGKSTTVAALAAAGFPVVTDDLLVITPDLDVHAGPRCVDLRRSSASHFPAAEQVDVYAGRRARFRLPLAPVPATTRIAGFITLVWDESTGLAPVGPADRLSLIASAATLRGAPINPRLMLELATLPSYVLHRPKRLESLQATIDLIGSVGSRGASASV